LRPVATGLEAPLAITHAGDGSGRLFVVEQGGGIRIVQDGSLRSRPFLDLSDLTEASGEQGLLGLAFHPDYEANGRLFVNYTDNDGDTVVAEYRTDEDDPGSADPESARPLLRIDQPFANHNGGNLVFGSDGYLYIGMGDGGSAGDPQGNGQALDTLLGKLLRIDVDSPAGGRPYGIPADNPFVGRAEARPEIWAYGLRNPWRFSFDEETGRLWIADVGQSLLEEVNRVPADRPGLDYGWNVLEGTQCFASEGCDKTGRVRPVTQYSHDFGCSITGGHVYRGSRFPELQGGYLFSDFCSGTIWAVDATGPAPQRPTELLQTESSVSSFGVDENQELYLTDLASGTVYQVTAR
jgi:glucose/arabinose dehydrogenase